MINLIKTILLLISVIFVFACQTKSKRTNSTTVDNSDLVADTLHSEHKKKNKKQQPDPLCYKITNEHLGYDSIFFKACKACDSITIKRIVEGGVNLNTKDKFGNTALMFVVAQPAETGNYNVVRFLLNKGAELNHVNIEGKTALTLARTYFNEKGHGNDDSRNICRIVALLKESGGIEQDYIDYLANNLSGYHTKEQRVVLNVKSKFNEFNKDKSNLKVRKIKNDSDISHEAYFSSEDSLKYYYNRNHYEIHYHDGDADNLTKKHYYFDDGFLYFYFEEFEDFFMKDKRQIRAYFLQDSLIVLSIKEYDTWRKCEKIDDINSLINVKCNKKFYTYKYLIEHLDEDIKYVKDSLKITKNCW